MDHRERESHASGMYPIQDTSAIQQQGEEVDKKNNRMRIIRNLEEMNEGKKGKILNIIIIYEVKSILQSLRRRRKRPE